jgi:hypothetical protein
MHTQSLTSIRCTWNHVNIMCDDNIFCGNYVKRRLSMVKEVESMVAASVARAGRLRQSVLKSAFEGKLA